MRTPSRWFCFALLAIAARSVAAQGPSAPSPEEQQAAAAPFNAGQWQAAHEAYAALVKRFPAHAISTFRLGVTWTELGHPADGERLLREGEKLGIPAGNAAYRLAENLAEQHKVDAAIAELRRALAAGFLITATALQGNAHLAALRSHPQWPALVDAFDAIIQPCRHDPRFRQFDFWVGDWDVRPTGAPASTPPSRNRITLEENSCVVQEHWVGQGGSTGQSFNLFDRSIGKWRQTWVDNLAGQHDYVGELKDGNMVFEGTTPAANGGLGRVPTRLTLFHIDANTVRQLSQVSADGGKTWTVAYDFTYVRRRE
ncbi:MAG: tetratricopeptide repeat protein [Gemmatimonadetes bacterium]|nr:tetratricopeptide repeat protein [Gemmatimonadota bacterium]